MIPIKNISGYGDEGAANHLRVSAQHLTAGLSDFCLSEALHLKFIKASLLAKQKKSLKRFQLQHQLDPDRVLFLKQNEQAINSGSFHNDIVSLANEEVFIFHQEAFADRS